MAIFPGSAIPTSGGYTIDQSLRFEDGSSAYLSRTPASAGNRKTWTYSVWVKRGSLTAGDQCIISANTDANNRLFFYFQPGGEISFYHNIAGSAVELATDALFRDPSAWYHFVISVDTTQATASDRLKFYVNGSLQTLTATTGAGYVPQNTDTQWNNNVLHNIGKKDTTTTFYDGYYSEVHFIDGQALDPDSFGEVDETYGHWKPIEYTGTYGTNGFYLPFSGTFYNDASGNGNNWTANNLAATDVVLDSPTNNFATFNPNAKSSDITLSEGNLKADGSSSGQYGTASTFGMTSGKWYSEYVITDKPSTNNADIGIFSNASGNPANVGVDDGAKSCSMRYGANDGQIRQGNTEVVSTGLSWANGDILSIAFDMDDGKIWFAKNGVWYNSGDPAAGTNASYSSNLDDDLYFFVFSDATSGDTTGCISNFGQDSSFAGNKTAQGNTDDNGYGDFYYSPPSGFLALCSANLDDPAVVPSEHFNTVLYTGTGSSLGVTGVGFQPDWVWIKERSGAADHGIYDAVRGTTKQLESNTTTAETTEANGLTAFGADGFTVGSLAQLNTNTDTYVAWNWKADNTSGSSNTDGSITSTVAANVDAGFSIVAYTGTGSNATVGHGLSSAPEMIIVKSRDSVRDWTVYHASNTANPETDYLELNTTGATVDNVNRWNDTLPTSSVFTIGNASALNTNAENIIAYCFHSVDGYSKFGSYTGNGSADGPFVYTGFRPAFVMIKRTDSAKNWIIVDAVRDSYNDVEKQLLPNVSDSEYTVANTLDIVSNGFKLRDTNASRNASGGTYIYMAFAESPFNYSTAR